MQKTKDKVNHAGHRQRLKAKVKSSGLKVLSDHEIIELLLTYTIPLKDTNPTAHHMMDLFGSLDNIIDADYDDLLKINGIGKETALFFNVLTQLIDIYKDRKANELKITSVFNGIEYFRDHYQIKSIEHLYVMCLNKGGKILKIYTIEGKSDGELVVNLKEFTKYITTANTESILLFHTHPNGSAKPSQQDIVTTQKLLDVCTTLGVRLIDHVILTETSYYTFGKNGILIKLLQETARKFKIDINKLIFTEF